MITRLSILSFLIFIVCSCQPSEKVEKEFKVEFEQFELENGLKVIFHIDRSDPVVAVALTAHVGSAREIEGRTGFAHLFEHLLFLESENLGKGGLDKMSARIGGSGANGSTSRDRTNYFQTVPNDALEKMIWAEADKLGYFINTVSEQVLAKEKQVVKNEKRQSNDNRPYGHTQYVIDKHLYPHGHPYSWQVIGSLEDLQNATLQDVKDFYNRWYVPNNSTLVVAGDFDIAQAKEWVEKYFAEIARGEEIPAIEKQPAVLAESQSLYYEDNFARLPELRIAWPGVPQYHTDSYALNVLSTYLTDGKKAPFNQVLVDDKKLTSRVGMYGYNSEIAGQAMISVRGFQDVDLDDVKAALDEAMAKFETEGISEDDLSRIKAGQETRFYRGLSSVLGKGFQLAQYNIFAGDPGYINEDGKKILAVTTEDVMRVYNQYIKDKPSVMTSFVPTGQVELAIEGAVKAEVPEEQIIAGAEEEFDASIAAEYEKSPSSFDRTIEPAYGATPESVTPEVWTDELSNGMTVHGITNSEVPLVQFNIAIKGGLMLEDHDKVGVSNLMAQIMTKGTANKTTEQLEEEIKKLGSSINVQARDQEIVINASCLSKNFEATFALVKEILLEPRWDDEEYALAMDRVKAQIKNQEANPNSIASNYFKILTYGAGHILANNNIGTEETLAEISIDDLRSYYSSNISPTVASFHVVGDISPSAVATALSSLDDTWDASAVQIPDLTPASAPASSEVFFYDMPGAKQSVIRFGYPALAVNHEDFYPATVANYILGGGGFASQLTQQLREGKGYTYGIGSRFSGTDIGGTFSISSGVRSNVTYESASLVKEILTDYPENYNEDDLEVTKGFLIKSNARAFETLGSKLGMLKNMSSYGWEADYAKQREQIVKDMTVEHVQELARKYMDPNKMFYLVVGDAETQLDRLNDLGFGEPVLINKTEGEL